jgi:DNA-nicking Smr family endonuclease
MARIKASPADREAWQAAMQGVTPLPGRPAPSARQRPAAPAPVPYVHDKPPPLDRFAGIDRANAERLKRGLHPIEARLDLHGMTQIEAHRALAAFIERQRAAGRRCVLIITGRGLGPNGAGVLKTAVPRWLEEEGLRGHVLALAPAQPRDGGTGALYLLLRRHR